jgi:hypothetical protein
MAEGRFPFRQALPATSGFSNVVREGAIVSTKSSEIALAPILKIITRKTIEGCYSSVFDRSISNLERK